MINFLQSDHQLIDDGDDLGERRLMIDSDGGAPVMKVKWLMKDCDQSLAEEEVAIYENEEERLWAPNENADFNFR